MELLFHRTFDKIGPVTEHDRPKAVQNVDVLIAVHVPQARAFGAHGENGIDHFLPLRTEAGNDSRIRELRSILLGHALGFARSLGAALN